MMQLTAAQQDALVELLNIGFGRAAASLSQLTGHRVLLDVPQVSLHPIEEVGDALERNVHGHVASVHQIFTGPVGGDALLILDETGAAILKELPTNEPALPLSIDASVAYGLNKSGTQLTNADIQNADNPFNTYKHMGLPPTPIASPGEKSIDAVLNPAQGPWLFWMTVNDDTGETKFATTFAEHQKNQAEHDAWVAQHASASSTPAG